MRVKIFNTNSCSIFIIDLFLTCCLPFNGDLYHTYIKLYTYSNSTYLVVSMQRCINSWDSAGVFYDHGRLAIWQSLRCSHLQSFLAARHCQQSSRNHFCSLPGAPRLLPILWESAWFEYCWVIARPLLNHCYLIAMSGCVGLKSLQSSCLVYSQFI